MKVPAKTCFLKPVISGLLLLLVEFVVCASSVQVATLCLIDLRAKSESEGDEDDVMPRPDFINREEERKGQKFQLVLSPL
jgi:hypothetical protein